jgi:hypothetical protein
MCLPIGAAAIREASSPAALARHKPVQKAKPLSLKEEVSQKNGAQKARGQNSGKVMLLEC